MEHNHSLQSLTVKWTLVKLSEWPIYWDGVARLLSRVTSNHIRRLKFVILLQVIREFGDASDAPLSPEDTVDWKHVNDVTAHQCFDRLEKVHVCIERTSCINRSVAEVVSQLHRTAWHARGILRGMPRGYCASEQRTLDTALLLLDEHNELTRMYCR